MESFITGGIKMSEKGCIKCGSRDTGQKEVAMTGTGLSKNIPKSRFLINTEN
jgi:uncharacterized protein